MKQQKDDKLTIDDDQPFFGHVNILINESETLEIDRLEVSFESSESQVTFSLLVILLDHLFSLSGTLATTRDWNNMYRFASSSPLNVRIPSPFPRVQY
jgi:hypothetical protein